MSNTIRWMLSLVMLAAIGVLLITPQTTVQAQERIEYFEVVEGEMTNEQFEFEYVFSGNEGDVVIVEARELEVLSDFREPVLIVRAPNGDVLADTTDAFTFGDAQAAMLLPEPGDYTVLLTRADGANGETVGGFTVEVILAQPLVAKETVTATLEVDARPNYYTINSPTRFGITYLRTEGTLEAELNVNVFADFTNGLRSVATAGGEEMTEVALGVFGADSTYVVTVGEGLFSFSFNAEPVTYELVVIPIEE